jgi:polyferredoxin
MTYTLLTRSALQVNVIRDRNPLYVQLSDGTIRNGYTVKLLNKLHETRRYQVTVEGLDGAKAWLQSEGPRLERLIVPVPGDSLSAVKLFIAAPKDVLEDGNHDIVVVVKDLVSGLTDTQDTTFKGPR